MADLESLTPRQRDIYNFIRSKIQGRGYGPTVREIGVHFLIKSPNGVMCHLKALQKKGLIHREPNMSRAIQLLEDPVNAQQMGLKLVGRIAAGQPIEAVEQNEELTFTEWVEPGDKFALKVAGESMIDEHIADGDFVIIRKQEQARDGQIVAVRDEDGEATLKRFYRERNRIRLEPANKAMKPIFRDRVNILGVLVGRRSEILRGCGRCDSGSRIPDSERGHPEGSGTAHSESGIGIPIRTLPARPIARGGTSRRAEYAKDQAMPSENGTSRLRALFTDGACSGNPGPGGWAYILDHPASGQSVQASVPSRKRPIIGWSSWA